MRFASFVYMYTPAHKVSASSTNASGYVLSKLPIHLNIILVALRCSTPCSLAAVFNAGISMLYQVRASGLFQLDERLDASARRVNCN